EECLHADGTVGFHPRNDRLRRVRRRVHTSRQRCPALRLDDHVRHRGVALRFRDVVHRVAIDESCAAAEVGVWDRVATLPAHHFFRCRYEVDQGGKAEIQVAARNLVARGLHDVGVSALLLTGHSRNRAQVYVTVDETWNEVETTSLELRYGSLPSGGVLRGRDDGDNATLMHRDIGITELAPTFR